MTARDRAGQPVPVGPIREPVPGAPYQPGDLVRVVAILDSTADAALVGAVGRVVHLEYSCGCGQRYPDDPMIGVELDGGVREEFWRDELATACEDCDGDGKVRDPAPDAPGALPTTRCLTCNGGAS